MEKNTRLSVVIPTLWKVDFFQSTLEQLQQQQAVGEIIIISNAEPTKDLSYLSKVKVLQMPTNIGVNPAWNLGAEKASYDDLLILNDDYTFDLRFIDSILSLKDDYGMISINQDKQVSKVVDITTRPDGFGCAFYINKETYVTIPDDLKVYFGDDWLFQNCLLQGKKIALMPKIKDNGILSISSRSFTNIVLIELHNYMKHLNTIQTYDFKFSIVVPYYHESADVEVVNALLDSFDKQSFTDFEVRLIHDGPNPDAGSLLLDRSFELNYQETSERYDDWGHSLRDIGISEARGEYIVILNCDNKLYDFALEELDRLSKEPVKLKRHPWWDSTDILVFPIYLRGQTSDGFHLFRDESLAGEVDMILTGYPVAVNYIDCMQLVMRKIRWDYYGGWSNKSFAADGEMYPRFAKENLGVIYSSKILGEHL